MSEHWIISGAYGVGKSEFSVQWALTHAPCTIGDLDVLNPFFRPREIQAYLENHQVKVVASHLNQGLNQDLPAMSFAFQRAVLNHESLIFDCAGSENGLRPLHSLASEFDHAHFWIVVNLSRPESSLDKLDDLIDLYELHSGRSVDGLVHNTHLLDESTVEDVMVAQELLESYAQKRGLPIVLTMMPKDYVEIAQSKIHNPILGFDQLHLREEWMKGSTR